MSNETCLANSKFGNVHDFIDKIEGITKKKIIVNIEEVEEIEADIMVIAPCSRKRYCKILIFHI